MSNWQKSAFFTWAKLVFVSTGYYLIKTLIMVYCFSNYSLKVNGHLYLICKTPLGKLESIWAVKMRTDKRMVLSQQHHN